MRTLVLAEFFLPAVGGSINWLVNTYSRYDPLDVVLVAPQHDGETVIDQTLPFRVERIPMTLSDWDPTALVSFSRYSQIIWHVYKIYHAQKSQQIHCAKVLPEGFVAWCINLFNSMPYIVYAHGEEIQYSLTSRKLSWLLPKIYNQASAIIANSQNTKVLLENIGVHSKKIHIINPGVNVQYFNVEGDAAQTIRQRHHLGEAPVILTVGRMQRRKGQDMVIKALPHIQQKIPQVKYVIVGSGEELSHLEKLVREFQLTDSVIFAGRVPDNELAAYYAACDVFAMPNQQIGPDIEGFGMVYLEAGAARKPVIGGKSGGTEDAIIDNLTGLRVDGTNIEEIATAITSLLLDPARAQAMGECGRRRVEQEFTWEAVVERTRLVATLATQGAYGHATTRG